MTIRFGVSPIAWVNDDMPELGAGTSLETILGEARDIGFAGVELGGVFPRQPAALGSALRAFDLALVGGWYGSRLLERDVEAEIAASAAHLALLEAMGSTVWIHAETSNAIHGQRGTPLDRTPRLDDGTWPGFGRRLSDFAAHIAAHGLRFAYHPHLGTVVESPQDLATLVRSTGEVVGLTLDTGHAALGGLDPASAIRAYRTRIAHVHCKDVRRRVFAEVTAAGGSFLDGVMAGMFAAPGDGDLEFGEILRALAEIGYGGWIVAEAEQDPAVADPRVHGALGLSTLEQASAEAGLTEVVSR